MAADLKRTPLHSAHADAGARLVDFAGWEMPVQYKTGIKVEHRTVREAVGLFDVSHMGEVRLRGDSALADVQRLVTNDASKLEDGGALYTVMCYPDGGIVDDCIVYRFGQSDFLIILNASNRDKDVAWIREHATSDVTDESDDTALIAVQGPAAVALVDSLAGADMAAVPRFHHVTTDIAGIPCFAARTGYTGEDGFEVACPTDRALELWNKLLETGASVGAAPIGLGARDTLRLEARLSLYGNDIDNTTNPYEAGLGWVVKLAVDDFIGKDALTAVKQAGVSRKLVGFTSDAKAVARAGYDIVDRDKPSPVVGRVTSGGPGLTVGGAIGLGYVPTEYAKPGTTLTIDRRGKDIAATVVKGPFYRRGEV